MRYFYCRKTSLAVGAASAVARKVVVCWGRNIPLHQAEHTERAQYPAYKASPLVARKNVIKDLRVTLHKHVNFVFIPGMILSDTIN